MIVPTRFGLKYAPIPTLALEYEDDLKGVVDATGESSTSLYVYRDGNGASPPTRKLHVVELPMLTRTSETEQITRQLQQDNGRFLAPGVVNETQLKRLLDRLVQNLPETPQMDANENEQRQPSLTTTREAENAMEDGDSGLEESMMEESVIEESVAEASQSNEHQTLPPRGEAQSDKEGGDENEAETTVGATANGEHQDEHEDSHGNESDHERPAIATEKESEDETKEDAKKTKALRSESDVSEEEVESEELEYFSEDGSDEDSF
ncbi:hypothetical protein F441_09660 [Phytophthora nicotianae CJ01A1]|uniref:Uncharacterized protein n=3 Tax=Phytophthora nicotianae TaxID=4792 RepID=A0A0W8CTZ3_PHYNI|nr:hypothetical protein L917_09358 [Phytophthora nicotianae]ETO74444.1 hypothetical protein F444_09791 [Phytophthora nicotianae P1976]ETP15626.1 hypothetical protein F441_09660 [Phytophthora nicotianae CJ01A1]KUF87460.1 hypothetical protein AM587_10010683 [Phytophthora nicotianae]KUF99786.1 hypothetical protein AM588_10008792 [Phytophthora nicotianae]